MSIFKILFTTVRLLPK